MIESENVEVAESGPFNLLSILLVLVRRKRLFLYICSATLLFTAGYTLTLHNVYSAATKVLPPQKEAAGLPSMLGQMGGLAGLAAGGKGGDSELYVSIVKSRSVGDEVIRRLGLAKRYHAKTANEAWRKFDRRIKVQSGKDGIIVIAAEDEDPRLAALMANTVADELGLTLVRLNLSKVGSERLFLEKRLEVVKKDLERAEDDVKDFSQRHKIVHVEAQSSASVAAIAKLKGEIASKEVQLAVLRKSQTDENFESKSLKTAISRLRGELSAAAGSGGGEGVPSAGEIPEVGLEYSRKLRELKVQETLFEQLTKQYEMAKLNQAKDSSTLQILDEAKVPDEKVSPKRASIVLFAAVLSFLFSAVLAFVLELLEKMPETDRKLLQQVKRQALSFK